MAGQCRLVQRMGAGHSHASHLTQPCRHTVNCEAVGHLARLVSKDKDSSDPVLASHSLAWMQHHDVENVSVKPSLPSLRPPPPGHPITRWSTCRCRRQAPSKLTAMVIERKVAVEPTTRKRYVPTPFGRKIGRQGRFTHPGHTDHGPCIQEKRQGAVDQTGCQNGGGLYVLPLGNGGGSDSFTVRVTPFRTHAPPLSQNSCLGHRV